MICFIASSILIPVSAFQGMSMGIWRPALLPGKGSFKTAKQDCCGKEVWFARNISFVHAFSTDDIICLSAGLKYLETVGSLTVYDAPAGLMFLSSRAICSKVPTEAWGHF